MKRILVCLSGLTMGLVLFAASVANAQPRPAQSVPPLPPGVTVAQPVTMCPGMSQSDVCTALNNALHPPPINVPPPPARDDRAARAARQATCMQEAGEDPAARCRCRGLNLGSDGQTCVTALGALTRRVTNLEHRVDAIEARLGMGGSTPAPTVAPVPTDPTPSAGDTRHHRRHRRHH